MSGERQKGILWTIHRNASGNYSYEAATLAVLMDLRDELERLNALLHCSNFTGIPATLRSIRRALPPRALRRKKKRAPGGPA